MLVTIGRNLKVRTLFKYIARENVLCSRRYVKAKLHKTESSAEIPKKFNIHTDIPEAAIESCDFKNGMRLICERRHSFTTTIGCFLPAGAMYEIPEERGSALFLEHLLFKRTAQRSKEQIEKDVEEIGGSLNAAALRDKFLFYGTVPSCNIKPFVHLLVDIIQNGITCVEDVMLERYVILNELAEVESDKRKVIMDYLQDVAYQDTALAKSVYPETKVIKNFCAENLIAFRNRVFRECIMTMVCVGPISLEKLQNLLSECFIEEADQCEPTSAFYNLKPNTEKFEYRFSGSELRFRDDDEELAYVAIGFEGPSCDQRQDHFVLTVAKQILGSWDKTYGGANHNAPFIAHCAFNTNVCEMYESFFLTWKETSMWGSYFVCGRLTQEDMIYLLKKSWMRLCTTITEKEVARAVNECKIQELLKLEDPEKRFFDITDNLSKYGYYETVQKRLARYERVTAEKIREAAIKYIYDQSPAVAALGCIENLPEYVIIRSETYSYRY